jgi:putative addiction module component (TIGR02574 family)
MLPMSLAGAAIRVLDALSCERLYLVLKRLRRTSTEFGVFDAMTTFNDIFDATQTLAVEDQLRLIEAIWDHLPPNRWPMPDEAWVAESQRRSAACDAGTMSASSWSEVKSRARKEAGLNG